jgi:ribonuclease HI
MQLNGKYKISATHLKPLAADALSLLSEFKSYTLTHIPRERNKQADSMARESLKLKRDILREFEREDSDVESSQISELGTDSDNDSEASVDPSPLLRFKSVNGPDYSLYFKGSYSQAHKSGGSGFILANDFEKLVEGGEFLDDSSITSTTIEFHALLKGLEVAAEYNFPSLTIHSDNATLIDQVLSYRVI